MKTAIQEAEETEDSPDTSAELEAPTSDASREDAVMADPVFSGQVIKVGSRVKIEKVSEGGRKMAFTLVRDAHDPDNGRIGVHTPLGEALLDAQEGDELEYQAGPYVREIRVLAVEPPGW
jgi:transcription elongation GreA/GreB family factor